VEAGFNYEARLIRDRFTSANVRAVLASLGIERRSRDLRRKRSFCLLREEHTHRAEEIERLGVTAEQAEDPATTCSSRESKQRETSTSRPILKMRPRYSYAPPCSARIYDRMRGRTEKDREADRQSAPV